MKVSSPNVHSAASPANGVRRAAMVPAAVAVNGVVALAARRAVAVQNLAATAKVVFAAATGVMIGVNVPNHPRRCRS